MSRPSEYSEERAAAICALIAEGLSLRQIAAREGMPDKTTILRWLSATNADGTPRHPDFRTQYARAREMQADHFVDEILEIADTPHEGERTEEGVDKDGNPVSKTVREDMLGHRRLQVDTRKWLMAKLAPKKYGERIATEVSGPDGGAIKTESLSDLEIARRVAFLLSRATQQTPQE
jgi:transposase